MSRFYFGLIFVALLLGYFVLFDSTFHMKSVPWSPTPLPVEEGEPEVGEPAQPEMIINPYDERSGTPTAGIAPHK